MIYTWAQISGPAVNLDPAASANPQFTPQAVGSYSFKLRVNDGNHDSVPDIVTVTVAAAATMKASSSVVNGATIGVLSCPKQVKKQCQVTVSLAVAPSARAKGLPVAKTKAKLKSGSHAKLKLAWSAAGLRLLKSKGSLPMVMTVVTHAPGARKHTVASRFTAHGH